MTRAIAAFIALLALHTAAGAATIHIVAFGDSNTAGYLVSRAQNYPSQLQPALRAKGYDVTVENAGVNGDTTTSALARFDGAIGPGTDIAIVEFGVNDRRRGATMASVRDRLGEIIRTLKARGIGVLLISFSHMDLADVAKANGVLSAQWAVPAGEYRARDGYHLNAQGYAIVVRQMLPQVEELIARISLR